MSEGLARQLVEVCPRSPCHLSESRWRPVAASRHTALQQAAPSIHVLLGDQQRWPHGASFASRRSDYRLHCCGIGCCLAWAGAVGVLSPCLEEAIAITPVPRGEKRRTSSISIHAENKLRYREIICSARHKRASTLGSPKSVILTHRTESTRPSRPDLPHIYAADLFERPLFNVPQHDSGP
jgi:hypothetical protein